MMNPTAADHTMRSRAAARLLLALLLALAPLLGYATAIPPMTSSADAAATTLQQMPCHPKAHPVQAAEQLAQDACPHCAGEDPSSQCHCCGYAAPAGLAFAAGTAAVHHPDGSPPRVAVSDPLPESPDKPLYRPPISHS